MDPIEIFELAGYVIDASASSPELSVFATEIRPYLVQQATAKNVVFGSEIRAYLIDSGKPKSGVALNTTSGYVIVQEALSGAIQKTNTDRSFTYRQPGVMLSVTEGYSIEHNPGSVSGPNMLYRNAGLVHKTTTMYTIEVP